jgi:Protein of unknown function (DUF1588)/Protein of unknown function (DUF1592)/Protein of unknown function (DUF1595)/Protein of unknown function (DUF1585)/Protein of unknown function (DUF1587)
MRSAKTARPWLLALAAAAFGAACHGQISGGQGPAASGSGSGVGGGGPSVSGVAGGGGPSVSGVGGGGQPNVSGAGGVGVDIGDSLPANAPSSVVRMLSQRELGNAIQALIGVRPQALSQLPADKHDLVYDRVVESQTVSSLHEDAFEAIADEVADKLLANDFGGVVPSCTPAAALGTDGAALGTARRPCIAAVIDALGPRAFRRALDPEQRTALLALYDQAASYRDGARLVVHGIFRSPSFLYLIEYGQPIPGRTDVRALTDDEVAARLSFGLCEMLPDDGLRAAAAAGQLHDANGIALQAERLLALPCAKTTVQSFWAQWFRLARLDGLARDATKYPQWNATLATAARNESQRFLDHVTWETSGSLRDVFSAHVSVLDATLAPVYGLTGLTATPTLVDLPPERRGILTQPSILALTSDMDASSPVKRGVFVLQSLLCQKLPQRPQNLAVTTPAVNDAVTTRQRWAQHSSDAACSFCHQTLDPVGFAMEDFDAIGRHRTTENGQPVDASGGIPSLGVPDRSLTGAAQLSDVLAGRDELRACFSRQWLRFALGRLEAHSDVTALMPLVDVARADGSIKQAFLALVRSEAFRQRPRAGGI